MLLAKDFPLIATFNFPLVATSATKPSESLHQWSGPEKEKTIIRSEHRRVPCHWVFSAVVGTKRTRFVVRNSEGKVSVGLRRAALYIMQCNRWDPKRQTEVDASLDVGTCIVQSLNLLHPVLASMFGLVLVVSVGALQLLLLRRLSFKSNNSSWTMISVERTFCQSLFV